MTIRLLMLLFTLNFIAITSVTAMEFKQAYAPISVGKITTFIPIERAPDAPVYVSVQPSDAGDKLVWSAVDSAKFYFIEQYINGKWEMVNANYQGTQYTLPKSASGVYRVTACDEYGCAKAKQQNRVVSEPLAVKAFYTNRSQVDDYQRVSLSWEISGAATVSITRYEQGRKVESWLNINPSRGTLTSNVRSLADFRLVAKDFNGETIARKLRIATLPENPVKLQGAKGKYTQPLFHSGLDIVSRSMLVKHGSVYFSTHDGQLMRYSAEKQNGAAVEWKKSWSLKLDGVVNNAPVMKADKLLFSVSLRNGTGKMCRVNASTGGEKECTEIKSSALIASPLIIKSASKSTESLFSRAVSFVSRPSSQLIEGVYLFRRDGVVEILDPNDMHKEIRTFGIPDFRNEVVSTPILISDPDNNFEEHFIVEDGLDVIGVEAPKHTLQQSSSIVEAAREWFNGNEVQNESEQSSDTLKVLWRKRL
ncbi:hypothetical protein C3B51_19730 [Pseudoalteromonas rubra]|uniref:Ig-like domain-containing protein n=2 Tax=Pseudoalteromonas rubra TaxID=43658 RepID=A0A4Q7DYP5_9GAMM|nr:hypothetical protein C3B51_19730 [Pseudoalteromonas rubra]